MRGGTKFSHGNSAHKKGGRPLKGPKLRLALKMAAEKDERRRKKPRMADSIMDLFGRRR